MKRIHWIPFVSLIALISCAVFFLSFKNENKQMVVMAYYVPSNSYPLEDIPFEKLTIKTINNL